jgi:hypothetical protein
MSTETLKTSLTEHLLALMRKGDDAFNGRDFAAVDGVHHPNMVAHITGNAQPIYGREAHAAAMQQMLRIFPDMHVNTPYPIQFGCGDWITVVTRATGTFTGEMILPDGRVIAPTGKAFDVELGQTVKWEGDPLIEISAFWDAALAGAADRSRPVTSVPAEARGPVSRAAGFGNPTLQKEDGYAGLCRHWGPQATLGASLFRSC